MYYLNGWMIKKEKIIESYILLKNLNILYMILFKFLNLGFID